MKRKKHQESEKDQKPQPLIKPTTREDKDLVEFYANEIFTESDAW